MKLLFLGVSFPFLLFSFLLGKDASNWAQLSPSLAPAKDKDRANASLGESQQLKPLLDHSWIYMYAPVRSCHRELREKYGEFSPPEYPNGIEGNIWCNWTVWAGARKHIVIYIKGFTSDEGCDKNEDKIFFNGVSSLAENMVIYACWKKEMHVFATYAQGVHVVFLMRHSTNLKKEGFMGRYYIFKHRETKPPDKDALGSKLPTPDPSQPTINSISLSLNRPFMPENVNSSLSSSHRIDKATDLPKSLQAKEGNISVSILASKFVWQVMSTLPLTSESLHLLHVSVDNEENSCSQKPEQLIEMQSPNVWGMEEMSVELIEPNTLSNVFSEVPHLDLSPIEPSGPIGGMECRSRTLSTSLVSFLKGDLQMDITATQPDYHALDTNSWTVSHDPVASTEESTWDFEEIIPISSLAHEAVSLQIHDISAISLLTPEQDLIGTKIHTDYVLLPSETSERGRLQSHPGSSVLLLSDVKLANDWETVTAPISEHIAKVLDVYPILESSGEMVSELKVPLAATRLYSILEDDLHLRHRSEQSSVEILLDILSENPGGSSMADLESNQLLDAATKHEISLFPSESTLAPLATTGLELSPFLLLGTMETVLFPTMELEPLLSYRPTVPVLLAVSDLDSTTLERKQVLSSTMTRTYPFISVELDTILSTPAMPLEPAVSEQESIVSSIIVETQSLGAEELECSISAMEHTWSQSATVVETAFELEISATVLEPVLAPATTIKSPRTSETISSFSHINEIVPSFDLRWVGADPAVASLWSSCCQPEIDASEQEDAFLATVRSSSLPVPVMEAPYSSHQTALLSTVLEHLFPSREVSISMKEPLLERKDVSVGRLGDKEAHVTPLNLAFKSELLPSFDIFTVSALSPLNGFITDMPQFVPIVGGKKQPESLAEYDLESSLMSTLFSLHSEMQTQVIQPITSWERPHNAEWNLAGNSLGFTVADFNVVGTLVKAQTQKETLDLQTLQIPSDFENKVASKAGHLGNHMELELPWLLAYFPAKSCHVVLKDEVGTFSPPVLSSMQSNIWCNWTIWAGPQKHIVIYIEGFEGNSVCEENQDKIIFQGVSSSVESKVVYACRNHGTLIFATQAVAVHAVFLSKVSSQNLGHKHFRGRYYIFTDEYETSNLTSGGNSEEPVLKSNSSTIFSPKSYAMHSRHILDFVKMSRKLSNETGLHMTSRQSRNNSSNAMSLQALLSMPLSNATQVSPLKSTENVTLNVLDVKMIQVAKPFFDDRTKIKISPNDLKKTLVWGSENLAKEEKVMLYKPTIPSAFPYISQKFRTMTKLVPEKDTGIISETSKSEVVDHITTHQKPEHMKDSGRTVFGKYNLQNGITFPQISLEEQGILIPPPPKSTPVEKQKQVLHALTSYDGSSKKTTKVMNFQHLELKEALEGEQGDNQDYRQENGSDGQYVAVAAATGRNKSRKAEFLTSEMPENVAIKRKSHLTTLGYPNVLSAPPSRIHNSDFMGSVTLNSWDVLLRNLKNIQVEATIASYPSSSGNTEHSLQKGTTPQHLYSLPDMGSSNEASLGKENKNSYENISVFRLYENDTILKSQHNPGDVLFEITFGIDHKGEIPHKGSEQEKALIESIKLQVQEKVKLFSNKIKEIGLKEVIRKEGNEMRRRNGPNLIFTFWLHLKPEEKNITHFIHSQLKDLSGESMGAGEIQLVSVGDVNECSSGIELCGDEAICLNGYGTYICQCKEEYEDHSLTKLGTICVHSPRSGIGSLYSYAEILVGTTVFFIFVLVVVVSVLCSIVKKRCTKEDGGFEQSILSGTRAHLQPTAFQQDNISNLLSLDPTKLKLRAKSPDWPLQPRTSPSETYRISIEQSECL